MKILCVCRKGNVRSVATKYALNRRGYKEVLTVGFDMVTPETLNMLCKWADIILVPKITHWEKIDKRFTNKIKKGFVIGDDIYGTPVNLKLEEIINKNLDFIDLI